MIDTAKATGGEQVKHS